MKYTNVKQLSIDFLEIERERLSEVIKEYSFNLRKPEVIEASQRMDEIMLYCCRSERKKNKHRRTF
ncbi:MAG: Spo0E family sporulation regulatory protein-aspartic acid phosphatase [Clostridia bacterium]|mgnify:CR=1 FL=1|nr:Spo0E family sporulation regulatory protein-aspartic acid phosphatase [Clostridia bacterium]